MADQFEYEEDFEQMILISKKTRVRFMMKMTNR